MRGKAQGVACGQTRWEVGPETGDASVVVSQQGIIRAPLGHHHNILRIVWGTEMADAVAYAVCDLLRVSATCKALPAAVNPCSSTQSAAKAAMGRRDSLLHLSLNRPLHSTHPPPPVPQSAPGCCPCH